MTGFHLRALIVAGLCSLSLALAGCSGSGAANATLPNLASTTQSVAAASPNGQRSPQYASAVPIYASAVPIYAGAVPIYAGAVPIYAGAVPICAPANATDASCNAVSPGTIVIYPAGVPASVVPGLHPADLQNAYKLPSATGGRGQTIGIVVSGGAPTAEADLAVYRSTFGLPPCTSATGCFRQVDSDGGSAFPAESDQWAIEAAIDTQIASAVCPNCNLILVEAKSTKVPVVENAINEAISLGATVISNSYAYSEDALTKKQRSQFQPPQGVAFVAGTGDSGKGATWPASESYAIAVGGTTLTPDGSPRGWSETAWQGSGGGCSAYVDKPVWQTDASACTNRFTADVSAFADPNPGASVYVSVLAQYPGWRALGGTSVATPIVAGAIALAGNASQLTDASFVYANRHAGGLFPVAGPLYARGIGSPRGTASF